MIQVLLRCDHPGGKTAAVRLRRRARTFLAALGVSDGELSLSIVGDRAIRALNRSWRGKDARTDVLSFPLPPGGPMLGDVVISLDTAERVARAGAVDLDAELDRYLAHGILHLLGHDHADPGEAKAMAAAEERLLSRDGLVATALRRPPVERRAAAKRGPRGGPPAAARRRRR